MPTTSERRALLFLGAVVALGGAVRLARAARHAEPAVEQRAALSAQLSLVERAAAAETTRRGRARRGGEGGAPSARSRPPRRASSREGRERRPSSATGDRVAVRTRIESSGPGDGGGVVDLDRASAEEMDRLPGIGPALAKRILDDREQRGPFGSLEGFTRVRGIGPALAERLRDRVTFSGTARPDSAVEAPRPTSPSRRQTRRRGARW